MCGFGPFESAMVRVEPGGTRHRLHRHLRPRPGPRDDLRADHRRLISASTSTTWSCATATPPASRWATAPAAAAAWRWAARPCFNATMKVQEKARRIAASMLEAGAEDVVLEDRQYQVKGAPASGVTLAQIAERAYTATRPATWSTGLEATDFFRPPQLVYPFGAHVAVVEVDRDTGPGHASGSTSRWTTAACASAPRSWRARSTAASRRASRRPCWRTPCTVRTASS